MTNWVQDGWAPTGMLRWLDSGVLQQLWAKMEGRRIAEWRDVPTEDDSVQPEQGTTVTTLVDSGNDSDPVQPE